MKNKHKILSLLLDNKGLDKATKKAFPDVISRYNDIMLCERMKWSQRDIQETDVDFYEDTLLVLQLQSAKEKKKKGTTAK